MAKILLLVMCVCCWLWITEGQPQSCTNGFPTLGEVVGGSGDEGSNDALHIIPELTFTCSGFITKWILSAQFNDENRDFIQLQVWRFINGESAVRTGSTTITVHTENVSEIYEYQPETPLRVEEGDVLGIFQPDDPTLRVYKANDGPTNYIIDLNNQPPPATLTLASADDTNDELPLVTAEISIGATTSLRLSPIPHTPIPHTPTATIPSPHPSQPGHHTMNGSDTTSLRLSPTPHILIPHTPTAIMPSPHPSQPGHLATNGSGESDNTLIKAIVGGVVGGVVLSALLATVMALLFCLKKRRTEMADSKEEFDTSSMKLREKESLDNIHIHHNKAYVPTTILTDQNTAYGVAEDYTIDDSQQPSVRAEGYVVNHLLYEDTQSQSALTETSDLSYEYVAVTR